MAKNHAKTLIRTGFFSGLCLALACATDDNLPPTPTPCSAGHPCYQLALAQCTCCPSQALCEQTVAQLCARDALLVGAKSSCAAQLPFDPSQCDPLDAQPGTLAWICFGQTQPEDAQSHQDGGETQP